VLKSEGGWSDNPAGSGGATTKGVTLANFRSDLGTDATKADPHKTSDDQGTTVHRRFLWDAVAGTGLAIAAVAGASRAAG
jgi:lysozyme family protein